MKVIPEIRRAY